MFLVYHLLIPDKKKKKKLNQDLSKHQEVGSNPVTKVTKFIVNFWDLLGAKKKVDPKR